MLVTLVVLVVWMGESFAYRIVVLYAAASPILKKFGLEQEVVGVTRKDNLFPQAVKVGSHLRPNIELIKALRPDLIIAGSHRAFPEALKKAIKAEVFYYDPRNLEEILEAIRVLGRRLHREREARALIRELRAELSELHPLSCHPRVVYEISQRPLKVAGQRSIITSIIKAAGGENPVKVRRKHVLISPEEVLLLSPDIYFYQVGPMNKDPVPPKERSYFSGLKSKVIQVNELSFARPGLNAFSAALKMNRLFEKFCEEKRKNLGDNQR